MIPGRVTRQVMQADRPGLYRGQCAEYCGLQHSLMAFDVVVLPRAEFDTWLARLAEPVREPPLQSYNRGGIFSSDSAAANATRCAVSRRAGADPTSRR